MFKRTPSLLLALAAIAVVVAVISSSFKSVSESESASVSESAPASESSDLSIQVMDEKVPQQLLKRIAYTASYNKDTRCPNWVYWNLTADHIDGSCSRTNKFYADTDVPEPRADWRDFKGTGWSRGHMCPAGDCKWDEKAMYETFLLSNIVPQNPNLNQGDWNELETMCRKWAKKFGNVHIVCGPLPYDKPWQTISNNKIVVPRALFKVVLCTTGTPKAIGFVYKNAPQNNPKKYYVNSVRQVERLTGIEFFPALPDDIEENIETNVNAEEWGI